MVLKGFPNGVTGVNSIISGTVIIDSGYYWHTFIYFFD